MYLCTGSYLITVSRMLHLHKDTPHVTSEALTQWTDKTMESVMTPLVALKD